MSFLSVFFFSTNSVVFWLFSCRQIVAELFYVLVFIILLNKNLDLSKKRICYLIFGASLVVSHYSTVYIFLFLIASAWFYVMLFERNKRIIEINHIFFILVFSFCWYIYVSSASTFNDLLDTVNRIYQNFISDFFRLESRGSLTVSALGGGEVYTLWHMGGRFLFYLSELFTIAGFVKLMMDRKKGRTSGTDFELFAFINLMLVLLCIVVPNFSNVLQVNRFYQIALLFIAPLCIIGGRALITLVSKKSKNVYAIVLLSLFIIPFFLFQSGFVYALTGSLNWSIPLSFHKGDFDNPDLYNQVVYEQEVVAAQWLRKQTVASSSYGGLVYADPLMCDHVLTAYGVLAPENMRVLTNVTRPNAGSYVYLGRLNTIKEIFGGYKEAGSWNARDFSYLSENLNKIYSNGASEIYMNSS
jgi:uncharacterized membrane protein